MTSEMFDPEKLLTLEWPDDTTIAQAKALIIWKMRDVVALIKPRSLHVRFLIDGDECPDEMTVGEWRRRNGTIDISEGGGGVKTKKPEPVLV
jgi:hypothetical protein